MADEAWHPEQKGRFEDGYYVLEIPYSDSGEPIVHRNLAVFPIIGGHAGKPPYDTLKEALGAGTVTLAEVSSCHR